MAQLVEINQIGKREDLRDFISIVDMKDKPLLGMLPKLPDQKNMLVSWQADAYATPVSTGIADGQDVDSFENAAANRGLLQNYGQKFRRTAMVGDLAENVSNVAGASAGELARSIDKKLEEIARDMEFAFGGDQDAQLETGTPVPYKTRGLGTWVQVAAQTTLPVPATFRTPTASIVTGINSNLTESAFRTQLQSIYTQLGKRSNLGMVCGPGIKRSVSDFTASGPASSSVLRSYNADLSDHKVTTNVTIYEGDFNTVEVYSSLLVGGNTDPTNAAVVNRAYLLAPEITGMSYNRAPRVMKLPDQGGGPRALVDTICCLVIKNPLALGKITS